MKVVQTMWFTNKDGCVGIVVTEDDLTKVREAYIGFAPGADEKVDTEYILDWGSKLSLEMALQLRDILSKKQ